MILAGDIGGTKTILALVSAKIGRVHLLSKPVFPAPITKA